MSIAAIAIAAVTGAFIAMSSGGASREAPLHLPPEPSASLKRLPAGTISVRLSPNLEGGQAGWCVLIFEESGGGGGTCGPLPTFGHPLLAATSGWTHGERAFTTVAITAPRVAYFLVDGTRRVATKPLPDLPYGLRVAIARTPLHGSEAQVRREVATTKAPTLLPLDARGVPIRESADYGASWFRNWNHPGEELKGPCELKVSGLARATAEWGQVATSLRPYPERVVGRGFLSCLDTEYFVPGHGIRASVLLDAASPGKAAPAPIPGMVPIPRLPGFYNDPEPGLPGEPMTARRQGNAWLVAAGGGKDAEAARVRLLRHLSVTVRL